MPETYGLPEPEPERAEQVSAAVANVVAGQGVVRRVLLYASVGLLAVSPLPGLAVVPLILLMATDHDLA